MKQNHRFVFFESLVPTLVLVLTGSRALRADTSSCSGANVTLPFTGF